MSQALVRLRVRQDTAASWTATNPVLAAGEPGFETDTGKIKYGDGVRNWVTLPYAGGVALGSTAPNEVGASSAGASSLAARADHSHALPANLTLQAATITGGASVGGNLTVSGSLVGGSHRHNAAEIDNLSASIFAQLSSAIKAGSNVTATVDPVAKTITISSTAAGTTPLAIASDPSDYTSTDGTALFVARAIGGSGSISYQWQASYDGGVSWSDSPGANGASLALSGLPGSADGARYRLRATSGSESVFSLPATLSIVSVSITTQPPDVTVSVGSLVTLTVAASAGQSAVSYQWQSRLTETDEWSDAPEAKYATYSYTASVQETRLYRAVATSRGTAAYSRTATVRVLAPSLIFSVQPKDTSDTSGAASFSVTTAGGVEPVTYRWQRLGGSSSTWAASDAFADIATGTSGVAGETTATLSLTSQTASQHGRAYRIKATDASGYVAFSTQATLSTRSLVITANPTDVSAVHGATLSSTAFTAAATADGGVTYQWQRSTNNGTTWSNISGATSASYGSFAVTYESNDGNRYRCSITGDGETRLTSEATLTVSPSALTISTQPTDATAASGSATFTFAHTGGPSAAAVVSWQRRPAGSGATGWLPIPGATTTTLTLTGLTVNDDGFRIRGVVQRGAAIATTNGVGLTVPGVRITQQPLSVTAVVGTNAAFTVAFAGTSCPSPTIDWEQRTSPAASWSSTGVSTPTLTISSVTGGENNMQYRAAIFCGSEATYSSPATLQVISPPLAIATEPQSVTTALTQATFSFATTGGDGSTPVIRWQRLAAGQLAGAWADIAGAVQNSLVVTGVTPQMSGAQYRAVITVGAETVTTRAAVLTVAGASITLNPADTTAVRGSASFSMDFASTACPTSSIQWEKRPAANTFWGPVKGGTGKLLSLTALTSSDSGWLYRAAVTCSDTTLYTSEARLTVPSYEFFTVQPASQGVKAGETVTFSYQGLFSASQYPARWQSRRLGTTTWTYQTPEGASQQSISFAATPSAHHNTEWRVEIGLPSDKLYSKIALLTVDKTTSIKTVALPGAADLIGLAYGKGAFVALTSDQTGICRRSTNGGDTWGISFLPASRYWDGIVSTTTGALIAYSAGDSGRYSTGFQAASGFFWVQSPSDPPKPGVFVRSLDGGLTWQTLSMPFFVGSRVRMWSFPYANTLLLFYHDSTLTSMPAQYNAGGEGYSPRGGAHKMAVSNNDGQTWTAFDMPQVPAPSWAWLGTSLPDTRCPDITSAAISPSGIMVLTSRYQDFVYRKNGVTFNNPSLVSYRTAGWGEPEIVGAVERRGFLLYRNIATQGWGAPSIADAATLGVSTGVSLRTVTRSPVAQPWQPR